jgi:hypothetical protein
MTRYILITSLFSLFCQAVNSVEGAGNKINGHLQNSQHLLEEERSYYQGRYDNFKQAKIREKLLELITKKISLADNQKTKLYYISEKESLKRDRTYIEKANTTVQDPRKEDIKTRYALFATKEGDFIELKRMFELNWNLNHQYGVKRNILWEFASRNEYSIIPFMQDEAYRVLIINGLAGNNSDTKDGTKIVKEAIQRNNYILLNMLGKCGFKIPFDEKEVIKELNKQVFNYYFKMFTHDNAGRMARDVNACIRKVLEIDDLYYMNFVSKKYDEMLNFMYSNRKKLCGNRSHCKKDRTDNTIKIVGKFRDQTKRLSNTLKKTIRVKESKKIKKQRDIRNIYTLGPETIEHATLDLITGEMNLINVKFIDKKKYYHKTWPSNINVKLFKGRILYSYEATLVMLDNKFNIEHKIELHGAKQNFPPEIKAFAIHNDHIIVPEVGKVLILNSKLKVVSGILIPQAVNASSIIVDDSKAFVTNKYIDLQKYFAYSINIENIIKPKIESIVDIKLNGRLLDVQWLSEDKKIWYLLESNGGPSSCLQTLKAIETKSYSEKYSVHTCSYKASSDTSVAGYHKIIKVMPTRNGNFAFVLNLKSGMFGIYKLKIIKKALSLEKIYDIDNNLDLTFTKHKLGFNSKKDILFLKSLDSSNHYLLWIFKITNKTIKLIQTDNLDEYGSQFILNQHYPILID